MRLLISIFVLTVILVSCGKDFKPVVVPALTNQAITSSPYAKTIHEAISLNSFSRDYRNVYIFNQYTLINNNQSPLDQRIEYFKLENVYSKQLSLVKILDQSLVITYSKSTGQYKLTNATRNYIIDFSKPITANPIATDFIPENLYERLNSIN